MSNERVDKEVKKLDNRLEGEKTIQSQADTQSIEKPSQPVQKNLKIDEVYDIDDNIIVEEDGEPEGEEDINLVDNEKMEKYGL